MAATVEAYGQFSVDVSGRLTTLPVRPYLIGVRGTKSYPFSREVSLSNKLQSLSQMEGEDAALTGGTRSLHRRLLALNLRESSPAPAATDDQRSGHRALSA